MAVITVHVKYPILEHGLCEALRAEGFEVRPLKLPPDPVHSPPTDLFLLDSNIADDPAELIVELAGTAPVLLFAPPVRTHLPSHRHVSGVIEWSAPVGVIVDAIGTVLDGNRFSGVGPELQSLSARESQVLGHIADGLTQNQIADTLGISRHTVDTYIRRIRSKLGLGNKADMTRAAVLSAATM
ncbi:helix-turn-helix transcriptional regulator [Nonomuraea lactucae]|uniref:helix-turn-helix transcriptional regulator n=1 Tax=Nonomuraea lactucae TaxID=2249762 RepID=UPI000DE25FEC|nr:helix-turn-helix transcriptional regulator [Nonomuraea lactucae]